jgi:hypothetical protein
MSITKPSEEMLSNAIGQVVQVVNVMNGAVATGTTLLPSDDTIPTYAEGIEVMTLDITPTSATNKLLIQVVVSCAGSAEEKMGIALFQDGTGTDAAIASNQVKQQANDQGFIMLNHYMTSGTASSTTFNVRLGGHSSGTWTFNGTAAGRIFGGVMSSSITITEITV